MPLLPSSTNEAIMTKPRHKNVASSLSSSPQQPQRRYPSLPLSLHASTPQSVSSSSSSSSFSSFPSTSRLQSDRLKLPIHASRQRIIDAVRQHDTVVLVGETGSEIPQYLHESGLSSAGLIACSQPRRVACVSVASRVAAECGCSLGELVGYCIRFEERLSSSTRLCYITDGMLLRQALSSPLLLHYAVVIVDEAHERSINTDVLCLLLRRIQRERRSAAHPPLKLIIMSATLDADVFLRYFAPCPPCLHVEGRRWEVDVLYAAEPQQDYVDAAVTTVLQIHLYEGEGDVLVFLPGQEDIEAAAVMLEEKRQLLLSSPASSPVPPPPFSFLVLPLYAALAHEQQLQVFAPCSPHRKVVLATNIAETSLTIPGIAFVVDTGVAKHRHYDPATQLDVLRTADISKAEAWQRSGRAGRERAGKAFRLYTEAAFVAFIASPLPSLVNGNLASTVLQLKAVGVDDVLAVDWLSAPGRDVLRAALEHLLALGALETDGRLSSDGRGMVALPLDVDLAHALLLSVRPEWGCAEEMATVVAMLTVGNIFAGGAGGGSGGVRGGGGGEGVRRLWSGDDGDHLILLRVWREWVKHGEDESWCREMRVQRRVMLRVQQIRTQLLDTLRRLGLQPAACNDDKQTRRCIAFAFSLRIARRETLSSAPPSASDSYLTLFEHQRVWLHPSSALAGRGCQYVCYHELLLTRRKYMRLCCRVEDDWVREMREREVAAAAGDRGRELMTDRAMQRLAMAGAGVRAEAVSEGRRQREESSVAAAAAAVRKKPRLMLSPAAMS